MLQLFGFGSAAARQVSIALGLTSRKYIYSRFMNMEEVVALYHIAITNKIMDTNMEKEMELSLPDLKNDGCRMLCVAMDGAWQNCGSGHSYNSNSEHHLIMGNQTGKVLLLHAMLQACAKCRKGIDHDKLLCPKNWDSSSKAMEANGAAINVYSIFSRYNAYCHTIVMDDDSSSKNVLQRRLLDMKNEAEKKSEIFVPPQDMKKKKIADTGRLPATHPEPYFLADVNHWMRNFVKKIYKLARAPKSVFLCTSMDALRLKHNLNVCVHCNRKKPITLELFGKQINTVLEHHFGNHQECGEWCPFLKAGNNDNKLFKLLYRSKNINEDLQIYDQLKLIFQAYTTAELLEQIFHPHNTNKNKSMNRLLTKFVPKNTYFCSSIAAKGRIHMAVGINSVGYLHYFLYLFLCFGILYSPLLDQQHTALDDRRGYLTNYFHLPRSRHHRSISSTKKCQKVVQQTLGDKKCGLYYKSEPAALKVPDQDSNNKNGVRNNKKILRQNQLQQNQPTKTNISTYKQQELQF